MASLHEHLAFHTALLPQLHAQLGLPPTALATELQELRAVLADAVEERVERRKRDVAMWADKCDQLERQCKDYSTALGGPSIAGSIKGLKPVGELRKEQHGNSSGLSVAIMLPFLDEPAEALLICSMVASLHEHLAFHTALLPQLHAQLGLPPTALATELQELRAVLADAVEERVERRKRDVAMWADKCDQLERQCKDYFTALGGPSIAGSIKGLKPVALKSQQMVAFIVHVRSELSQLWDALMMSPEEPAEFACFWDDEPSEDLLTRHEDEAARLRAELASKHAILAKAQKWEAIVGEQRALAAAASDQTRLTGRGVRGDPGRLLREEKMRKRVEREKPKAELLKDLVQWEEERGRPFTMEGVRLLDTINEVREAEAVLKEQKKRGRAPTPQQNQAPAPRTASRQSQEPPAKRPRFESTGAKATPLGVSKNAARSVSTTKLPGNGRSVSATVLKSPTKTSGEFAVMGMGRVVGSRPRQPPQPDENTRKPEESAVRTPVAKAVAGRRQSFRPRPSLDAWVAGAGGRLPGMLFQAAGVQVKEEDES
ncbi:hypothetical protein RSAG8_11692, partial [Rhizoctonia solani AG-8 WAC10335]